MKTTLLQKRVFSLLCFMLIFLLLPLNIFALERMGQVKGNSVNVRKGPGTQFAQITKVSKGQSITILEEKEDWFKVKLPDGTTGWIANWLVQEDEKSTRAGTINGSSVNVRKGAGTTYPIIFKLEKGVSVTVLEEKEGWYQVSSKSGKGWVASWLVSMPNSQNNARNAIVTGSLVNIRQKPGTNFKTISQLKKGEKVEIIGQDKDWYQIKTSSGKEGWLANWLVSLEQTQDQVNPIESTPASSDGLVSLQKTVYVNDDVVNVRKGPSLENDVFAKVKIGMKLDVIGKKGDWLEVKLADGSKGWVAEWLTVEKLLSSEQNQNNSSSQTVNNQISTGKEFNKLRFVLDDQKSMLLENLGEKLKIVVSGVQTSQEILVKTGAEQGNRLIIEFKDTNLRKLNYPINFGGIKEIKIGDNAVELQFDNEDFRISTNYLNNQKSYEFEITYNGDSLVPVKQVKLNPQQEQAVVQIASAKKIDYFSKKISQNQLVIDLPKSSLQLASSLEAEQNVAFGPIRKVTSRQLTPDMVRVEAELAAGAQYQITQNEDYIVVGAKMQKNGSLAGKTIVIDPGHGSVQPGGWTDPGAIGKYLKLKEVDVNLNMALKVKNLLSQQGANVVMTHSTGRTYLSLAGRADVANRINADIFVSIHANSNTNRAKSGTSVYYFAPSGDPILGAQKWSRQKLAWLIQEELVKAGGRLDLGIIENNYAVLRETRVPSVLVETAFLSNKTEEMLLNTESFRQKMALGIYKGIEKYFSEQK